MHAKRVRVMMRILVVALMMVSVALAGCNDGYVPEAAEEPCVVVDPTDTRCLTEDELANRTADQVAHQHDYWQGRDTVDLLSVQDVEVDGGYGWCDGAYPIEVVLPPDGAVVFQGTGSMNITMDVEIDEENHNSGPLELWVKRADDDSPEFVAYMEDGETVMILVNESQADLPHQLLSAWEFWVYAEAGEAGTISTTDCPVEPSAVVGLHIDITRTRDPPVFPGHPDHWGDEDELVVMEAWGRIARSVGKGTCNSAGESSHPVSPCQMWWRGFGPIDGSIVPPGTGKLLVTVDADADGDAVLPPSLGLQFHGADTRTFQDIEPREQDDTVREYQIDLKAIETDGPYSEQSQWRFFLTNEADHGTYQGTFSVVVVAVKD